MVLDRLVGPQVAGGCHQVALQIAVGALAVLSFLGRGLSGDRLAYGSLVAAVLVGTGGSALPCAQGPRGCDRPGDGGERPLNIVVQESAGHEHGRVGSGTVGVSSGGHLVLLAYVHELLPDVGHVYGSEVTDTEEEGYDVTLGDRVVCQLFSSHRFDGEDVRTVLACHLGAFDELLGVGELLVHSGAESVVGLTLVGDGLPHGGVDSVLLVVLLAYLRLS